ALEAIEHREDGGAIGIGVGYGGRCAGGGGAKKAVRVHPADLMVLAEKGLNMLWSPVNCPVSCPVNCIAATSVMAT
ncbi:MAG: hypothetical protein ACK54R_00080, partial [Pirellulaceae bacterium]